MGFFFGTQKQNVWTQSWHAPKSGIDYRKIGKLREDVEFDWWIWRPILAGKCTLEGVLSGLVTVESLLALNGLIDMQDAFESFQHEEVKKQQPK